MADTDSEGTTKRAVRNSGAGGIWFLGFVGAFVYYIHFHSGTFWRVRPGCSPQCPARPAHPLAALY